MSQSEVTFTTSSRHSAGLIALHHPVSFISASFPGPKPTLQRRFPSPRLLYGPCLFETLEANLAVISSIALLLLGFPAYITFAAGLHNLGLAPIGCCHYNNTYGTIELKRFRTITSVVKTRHST